MPPADVPTCQVLYSTCHFSSCKATELVYQDAGKVSAYIRVLEKTQACQLLDTLHCAVARVQCVQLVTLH